ncbi:hypothetical protein HMPREF0682_0861 [Propionibacterium acidifaciens F0233]|uniref:Uncharacterized protein n=1 Tax=Propionibacterium acidifaciens F0233 TaxID=553198 RepID=U2PNC7_9ACTN|nr:hypothetical protein HMPREF0682_0861 [Propionibacterium acidifaciens F0233]
MQHRLVEKGIGACEPLVRSLAEALVLHDIITLGAVMAAPLGRSAGPLPRRRRGGGLGQCPERSGRARPPAGHHRHDAPSRCRGALREPVRGPRRSFHPRVDSSRGDGGTATVTQLRHR